MTIAEKLTQIAERMPLVYEAGQQSMIDESKIIEKTVSGSVIAVDDVSEIPHEVGVQLQSSNLLSSPFQQGTKTENGITFTDNGDGTVTATGTATADATYVFKNISLSGSYTLSGAVGGSVSTYFLGLGSSDYADIGNGVTRVYDTAMAQNIFLRVKSGVTINITVEPCLINNRDFSGVEVNVFGKNLFDGVFEQGIIDGATGANISNASYIRATNYIPVFEGVNYVFSYDSTAVTSTLVYEYTSDYTYNLTTNLVVNLGSVYTPSKNIKYIRFRPSGTNLSLDLKCQFEVGTASTAYEPYVPPKTYTANADGTVSGVKSISPYMTMFTETVGVDITATYRKSWGMQTEYDRFWDAYQNNGDSCLGLSMFAGYRWTDTVYNPKHPIIVTHFSSMYQRSQITDTKVSIDVTGGTGTNLFFGADKLKNIVKLIVSETNTYSVWFTECTALEEIRFEGTIGKSLDLHYSTKLSYASVESIKACLGGTAAATLTLPASHNDGRYDSLFAELPSNWAVTYA